MAQVTSASFRPARGHNRTTALIAATVGILLAVAGFEHGLFETLQGNQPTRGVFVQAIGPATQWWKHGGEDAFTIIPNFLATGLASMSLGVFIIVWSLLRRGRGLGLFLAAFVLLTLVGGGIGFVPFYLITWAYASRTNRPLSGWRKALPPRVRRPLAKFWSPALAVVVLSWLIAIEIAIWGYVPGQGDPDAILAVNWTFLLAALVFINLSFIAGFARDIEMQIPGRR
jgi:hypothetical protein